jgi:SAM-dependent methyltransferase
LARLKSPANCDGADQRTQSKSSQAVFLKMHYIAWIPPSECLRSKNGIWQPSSVSEVSYPDQGNSVCFEIEDNSYWFRHRNHSIIEVIHKFPPNGLVYDVGGGNGFVATAIQESGFPVAVVEPGYGAFNALRRGIHCVVRASLDDANFHAGSLPAVGIFDVVEHIKDDGAFLSQLNRLIQPGGRLYCTVPAFNALWSKEDIDAGHYRRYTAASLRSALSNAGFHIEFSTYLFSWLTIPILLFRSLPFRLLGKYNTTNSLEAVKTDHSIPKYLQPTISKIHQWEIQRLKNEHTIGFGSSLLCVASVPKRPQDT